MKTITNDNVKILDCTLRDGGYVNDWYFGISDIRKIFNALSLSGIDYIESGFLKDSFYNKNKTVFNHFKDVNNVIENPNNKKSKIAAMLVYGKFEDKKIIPKEKNINIDIIRFNFKKHEMADSFDCMRKIIDYGYDLFICPANIEMFSNSELIELINKVNILKPKCFSIVDTNGILNELNAEKLFRLIDNHLNFSISIGFHSHNNLNLSFNNAKKIMEISPSRNLIIDSSLFGMGRGAGNLRTEELIAYLNNPKYDYTRITEIIEKVIIPMHEKYYWGFSIPYYLSAVNRCHPNYSKYLINHGITSPMNIDKILKKLPAEKKSLYNEKIIQSIV